MQQTKGFSQEDASKATMIAKTGAIVGGTVSEIPPDLLSDDTKISPRSAGIIHSSSDAVRPSSLPASAVQP
jgi:hypothetical protein